MNVIVTGGSGLVGTYLQNYMNGTYLDSKDFDLTKEDRVNRMFELLKPDVVIHLAAKVGGISDNIAKPFQYYEDNVSMNTNIVKYARKHGVTKFVGVLSSCIYPDISLHYPLTEVDIHQGAPAWSNYGYGYSKRMLAVHIDIARSKGYNYSYIIPSNLYGEHEKGDTESKHFVGALLDKIVEANKTGKDHIVLYGDGTPLRQFTFAKDIAEIIDLIVKYDVRDNMNLGIEESLSVDEIARIALKATDSEHLKIVYDRSKPNGQFRKDIDCSVFKNKFPNYEFTSYIEGIRKTYYAKYG
jgi:GDP-L-fucose synthase